MLEYFCKRSFCYCFSWRRLAGSITVFLITALSGYAGAEVLTTAKLELLGRDQILRVDGYRAITTVIVSLSAPVDKEIVIRIKYGGNAVLNKDYSAGNIYSDTVTEAVFPPHETEVFIHIIARKTTNSSDSRWIEMELDNTKDNVGFNKRKVFILVR